MNFKEILIISSIFLVLLVLIIFLIGFIINIYNNKSKFLLNNKKNKAVKDIIFKEDSKRVLIELETNQILAKAFLEFGKVISEEHLKENSKTLSLQFNKINELLQNKETPEQQVDFSELLEKLRESLRKLAENIQSAVNQNSNISNQYKEINIKLDRYYNIIQDKDEELTKYKNGYDYSSNEKLIKNVLSVIEGIQLNNNLEKSLKNNIILLMENNVLRSVNVYRIHINVGDKFDPSKMFASSESKTASSESQVEKVYEVLTHGYETIEGNIKKTIKVAKVLAYKKGFI